MIYKAIYGLVPYSSQHHLLFLPLFQSSQICCLLQSYQVYALHVFPLPGPLCPHTCAQLFISFRSFPKGYLSEAFPGLYLKFQNPLPLNSSWALSLLSFFLCTYHYVTLFILLILSCFLSVSHYTELSKGGDFCLF